MRRHTAEAVADILGMVEHLLDKGRPRKHPGKPRPEAELTDGKRILRVKPGQLLSIDTVSLPAALRLARQEGEYTRHAQHVATLEIAWAYYLLSDTYLHLAEDIDNEERDTRQLIRAARKARRYVEKYHLNGKD